MGISDLTYPACYYRKSCLRTVVCQIQFNAILKVGQEPPVDFQEKVRRVFPKFLREQSLGVHLAVGAAVVPQLDPFSMPPIWRFKTEDDAWTAGLGTNFLSLETTSYERFPKFKEKFATVLAALIETYKVDHYVRVGLRYINQFSVEQFSSNWNQTFNSKMLGPMADPILGTIVKNSLQFFVLGEGDWTITVRHGTQDDYYLLDLDHATEARVNSAEVSERLRQFNHNAYQVFRWAITDQAHQAMEPGSHE